MLCAMDEFIRSTCRAGQAHTDNSESASEFELQPLSRKTAATLPGDSSSGDKWSESSSCSSSWKKM